jgi:hypothetical protein
MRVHSHVQYNEAVATPQHQQHGHGGDTKGWTSDSGWVCMLMTNHRLLATALGRVGGAYFWLLRSRPSFSSAYFLVFQFLFALSLFVVFLSSLPPRFPLFLLF